MICTAHKYINRTSTMVTNKTEKTAFTRNRKLPFTTVVLLILNMLKKSLQIELDNFFYYVIDTPATATKQAFSKARQKIKPDLFRELFNLSVRSFYKDKNYNTYKGFHLLAIDGTTIDLPNYEKLKEVFSHVGNKEQTVRVRASFLYDILNQIIIAAEIDNYRTDERTLAKRHDIQLDELKLKDNIILYDRGYPSRGLIAYHLDQGIHFYANEKSL